MFNTNQIFLNNMLKKLPNQVGGEETCHPQKVKQEMKNYRYFNLV